MTLLAHEAKRFGVAFSVIAFLAFGEALIAFAHAAKDRVLFDSQLVPCLLVGLLGCTAGAACFKASRMVLDFAENWEWDAEIGTVTESQHSKEFGERSKGTKEGEKGSGAENVE